MSAARPRRGWFASRSGRLHWGNTCSGGIAPHTARKVAPSREDLAALMAEAGRPGICKCAWQPADKVIRGGTVNES